MNDIPIDIDAANKDIIGNNVEGSGNIIGKGINIGTINFNIGKTQNLVNLKKQEHQIKKHLRNVIDKVNNVKYFDNKLLQDYYVKQDAVLGTPKSWFTRDEDIRSGYHRDRIKDVRKIIEEHLLLQDKDWYLIVGAPFGIGKTSLSRTLCSDYANVYLDNLKEPNLSTDDLYIPILIFLNEGLVEGQNSLEYILNLLAPSSDGQESQRKILLVLDGLDEFDDTPQELIRKLTNLHDNKYINLKVLITTRLLTGLEKGKGIRTSPYIRLLSFTPKQVDEFFARYNVNLSYDYVRGKLGLRGDEITKPLFVWMLAMMHSVSESEIKIHFRENWTGKMNKALMYFLFFHHTIKGKYADQEDVELQRMLYLNEKEALRRIAAIKQVYPEGLVFGETDYEQASIRTIKEELEKFQPDLKLVEEDLKTILKSYFYFQLTDKGRTLNFLHNTLMEYLLAEYYIESLLEVKIHRLNITEPSEVTIEFVEGLLELMHMQDKTIARFMSKEDTSLLKSFKFTKVTDARDAIDRLKIIAEQSINHENIILYNVDVKDQNNESRWKSIDITSNQYRCLWIHRWICLFLLNKLLGLDWEKMKDKEKIKAIDKEKLIKLIKFSSNLSPSACKNLRTIDLSSDGESQYDLSYVDLAYADLSYSDLHNIKLGGASFYRANLYKSNLSNSKLINAYISSTNLSNVNLSETTLSRADLSGSVFDEADLTSAIINRADLSYANLSHAKLTGASLVQAKLADATGVCADFSKSNLSSADLSNAKLYGSIFIACTKFTNMMCTDADFENALIDNDKFISYLKGKARNIPDIIVDLNELRNKLEEKGLSEDHIQLLLKESLINKDKSNNRQ